MPGISQFLRDIRFWIVLFFIARLTGITNPPLEVLHNWRQTTVTMVTRNFLEVDNNIFYPRLDIAGDKTGITGMEFPLLNYLSYLVAGLFGYEHWYGRLINLVVSSFGLFFFFKLLRKYFDEKLAFYSTFVLLVSIWFGYSRKIMPDTFAMSFVTAGIYFGTNYLDNKMKTKGFQNLLLYAFLVALGTLSKISTGYILILFLIPFLNREIPVSRKMVFAGVSFLCILPTVAWYFYWVPHLVEKYEYWHFFMGEPLMEGAGQIFSNLLPVAEIFYFMALKYSGFAVFLGGLVYAFIKKEKLILGIFLLAFMSFLIIVLKAGGRFYVHSYYLIPFVPVMAFVCGYVLSGIKDLRIAILLLAAISVEGISNQLYDFNINKKKAGILNLENDLDRFSGKEDLILINSDGHPTPMYFAQRKGWVRSNEEINDKATLENFKNKGLKYVVILKRSFGTFTEIDYPVVHDDEDYRIYKL